jgi:hypothetical protein
MIETETRTKLAWSTPPGGDAVTVGAVVKHGPIDVEHYDQIRVTLKHHAPGALGVVLHVTAENVHATTETPIGATINLVTGQSDSIVYPVPGEKLRLIVTASGPSGNTAKYDLFVYGSR